MIPSPLIAFDSAGMELRRLSVDFNPGSTIPATMDMTFSDGTSTRVVRLIEPTTTDFGTLKIPQVLKVQLVSTQDRSWERQAGYELIEVSDEHEVLLWAKDFRVQDEVGVQRLRPNSPNKSL